MTPQEKLLALANKLIPGIGFNELSPPESPDPEGKNNHLPEWVTLWASSSNPEASFTARLLIPLWDKTQIEQENISSKMEPVIPRDDPRRKQIYVAAVLLGILKP